MRASGLCLITADELGYSFAASLSSMRALA